jgi:hypothetical protein
LCGRLREEVTCDVIIVIVNIVTDVILSYTFGVTITAILPSFNSIANENMIVSGGTIIRIFTIRTSSSPPHVTPPINLFTTYCQIQCCGATIGSLVTESLLPSSQ